MLTAICDFHLIRPLLVFLFQCCQLLHSPSEVVKVGVRSEEIKKRILQVPGPFTTARRVYTSFSSRNRPSAQTVQLSMEELENDGLGTFKIVNKLKVFYKKLPSEDMKANLSLHEMSLEVYIAIFREEDPRLTTRNKDTIFENHPNSAELDEYMLPPAPGMLQQ